MQPLKHSTCSNVAELTPVRASDQTKRLDYLTQAHLARRLRVENRAENVFSQGKRKQPRTDLTDQQNWSGDVEEERGCRNKAPQSSQESRLSPLCLLLGTRLHNDDRPRLWLKDELPFSHSDTPDFNNIVSWGSKGLSSQLRSLALESLQLQASDFTHYY